MLKKIVIALGGNALGNTPEEQLELVARTAKPIVDLIEHGNGPQVGMINLGMSSAAQANVIRAPMPFPECAAMSQGYIGFHLQNRIGNELAARGLKKEIVTLVTQVLVNEDDPGFSNPTKPIGSFYSREDAKRIEAEKGYRMVEDGGRGYRRVVPSPKPVDVIEKETVAELMESGSIVITVGGGGIPVIRKEGKLEGIAAVIDKDFASAKLAELIHADMLFILTAVDRVAINWGKPDQKELAQMTIREAEQYCREGHFAPGSMLPKVQAAVSFAKTGGTATIASLDKAVLALKGISGTRIIA